MQIRGWSRKRGPLHHTLGCASRTDDWLESVSSPVAAVPVDDPKIKVGPSQQAHVFQNVTHRPALSAAVYH